MTEIGNDPATKCRDWVKWYASRQTLIDQTNWKIALVSARSIGNALSSR